MNPTLNVSWKISICVVDMVVDLDIMRTSGVTLRLVETFRMCLKGVSITLDAYITLEVSIALDSLRSAWSADHPRLLT